MVKHLRHTDPVIKSTANRRLEIRFPVSEPITITLLESSRKFSGITMDVSETGLSFRSGAPLSVSSAVKIEFGGVMVLGELRYCRPLLNNAPLEYVSGVAIEQIVFGWKEFYTATCQASYSVRDTMPPWGASPKYNAKDNSGEAVSPLLAPFLRGASNPAQLPMCGIRRGAG
jgi:hypothetical protein